MQIAQGGYSLVVKSDGTAWTWGANDYGQLGDGTTLKRTSPVRVSSIIGVVQASNGAFHSLALKSNGTVWAWGRNNRGQLGDNTEVERDLPVRVPGLTQVIQVEAGGMSSFALKSDGTVWAWGYNYTRTPVQVSALSGIVQLSAGGGHTLALKSDRTVWAWGINAKGELGDGTTTDRNSPAQVKDITGVVQVVAGGGGDTGHSLALKSDGTVWGWGANYNGQLGNGTTGRELHPVQALDVTNQTYIALSDASSLSVQALELSTKLTPANLILGYGAPVTLSTTLKNALGGVLINQLVTF